MPKRLTIAFALGLFLAAGIGAAHAFPVNLSGASGLQINTGSNLSGITVPPTPRERAPQRFRDLTVVGDVGLKESDLPAGATIVRLRVDGHDVFMRLDTELNGADLQFDPNAGYARDLYRSILTKRIEVVGQQDLRDRIMASADKAQPIKVQGYVFDRTSPFFVVKSVSTK